MRSRNEMNKSHSVSFLRTAHCHERELCGAKKIIIITQEKTYRMYNKCQIHRTACDGSIDPRGFSPTAAHLGEISANFSAGSEIKIVAQRLLHETERKMVRRFSLSSRRHLHYYFLDK